MFCVYTRRSLPLGFKVYGLGVKVLGALGALGLGLDFQVFRVGQKVISLLHVSLYKSDVFGLNLGRGTFGLWFRV